MASASGCSESAASKALDAFLTDLAASKDGSDVFGSEARRLQAELAQVSAGMQTRLFAEKLKNDMDRKVEKIRDRKIMKIKAKVNPFIESVMAFSKACEGLLQAPPFAIGLVFIGPRLFLDTVLKLHSCLDALLEAMERIRICLYRYGELAEANRQNEDMQRILVNSYKQVIGFWRDMTRLLTQRLSKTFTKAFLKPIQLDIDPYLQAIEADCSRVQSFADAVELRLNAKRREDEIKDAVANWIRGGEDVSKLDVRHDITEPLSRHHDGTSGWIFDDPGFKAWQESKAPTSVLWLNASPGSGKTVLSSLVINRLQQQSHADKKKGNVIWFLCSSNDSTRQQANSVLRSLALQLLALTPTVSNAIMRIYEEEKANYATNLRHRETLVKVCDEFLKIERHVHIVIDGLDECSDMDSLLDMIEVLNSGKTPRFGRIKWFFSSRNEGRIGPTMSRLDALVVSPTAEVLLADVTKYLVGTLKLGQHTAQVSPCITRWVEKFDGSFLGARWAMDLVFGAGQISIADVEEKLAKFPSTISQCYQRSLERLANRTKEEQELARRTFAMLIGALQPLSFLELVNALTIWPGQDDYSADREPRHHLIEELCGSFLTLQRCGRGSSQNPIVKLSHKTARDFFLQDPQEADMPEKLHKYFITEETASYEIGRDCLRYLQYQRYQQPIALKPILSDLEPSHAFLKHAAVFWWQYYHDVKASKAIVSEIKRFIESPAFWTCTEVQCRVTPHLLARYRNMGEGSGSYRMGVRSSSWDASDAVGLPLPQWYRQLICRDHSELAGVVQDLHRFVRQWYEVLIGHPDYLSRCPMEPCSSHALVARKLHQSEDVKAAALGQKLSLGRISSMSVEDAFFSQRGSLKVRATCCLADQPDDSVQFLVTAPFSTKQDDELQSTAFSVDMTSHTVGFIDSHLEKSAEFGISSRNLQVTIRTEKEARVHPAPEVIARINNSEDEACNWNSICTVRQSSPVSSAIAYHFVRVAKSHSGPPTFIKPSSLSLNGSTRIDSDDEDEDEDEDDEDEDEDDESADEVEENGENGSDCDSEAGTATDDESVESRDDPTDCVVIIRNNDSPIWVPSPSNQSTRVQLRCAFHPKLPLVAWTFVESELCIADLTTGKTRRCHLPEPLESIASPAAAVRELHVSADGRKLYYLLATFAQTEKGVVRCKVALSTFTLREGGFDIDYEDPNEAPACQKSCLVHNLSYEYQDEALNQSAPYAASFWTEQAVYICLPLLTCSAKLVRFTLLEEITTVSKPEMQGEADTLTTPVFVPSCAGQRTPRILYQAHSAKSNDFLYLVCSSTPRAWAAPNSGSADDREANLPYVIRWKIPRKDGWRPWRPEDDGRSEELKQTRHVAEHLRGSFVDSERRYAVPVWGALDWTRMSVLTC